MAGHPAAIEKRLLSEGIVLRAIVAPPGSVEDAAEAAAIAGCEGASKVLVDGYHFGGAYQRRLKDAGLQVMALDDYGHADHYWADYVLNREPACRGELLRKPRALYAVVARSSVRVVASRVSKVATVEPNRSGGCREVVGIDRRCG